MKYYNSNSFTLIEVLVASAVVSIILLGVITASISLNNNARYAAGSYYVAQNTQTTLNHILNNASLAIGSPEHPGFVGMSSLTDPYNNGALSYSEGNPPPAAVSSGSDLNTFCIHQNFKPDGSFDNNDPDSNHRWVCYTFNPTNNASTANQIYWCIKDFVNDTNTLGFVGPGPCLSSDTFLGTALNKPTTTVTINDQSGAQQVLFTVTIENCLNPGDVSCGLDKSNNPYVSKTGGVSPVGHSSS